MRAVVKGDEYNLHHRREDPLEDLTPAWMVLCSRFVGWIFTTAGRTLRGAFRHPVFTITAATGYALWTLGVLATVVGTLAGVGLLVLWRLRWPSSFRRLVVARTKGALRAGSRYRPKWQSACEALALGVPLAGRRYLPRLVKVRSQGAVDVVTAKLLPGQTTEDWSKRGDYFAASFGAMNCRITTSNRARGLVDLRFLATDPFTEPVQPFKQTDRIDVDAVPVALRETGDRLVLPVRGNHFLLAGSTGAGKSGAIQALIDSLAPAVRAGFVRLHGIDMKGGIELAQVHRLFDTFEHKNTAGAADALDHLVTVKDERLAEMFGTSRLHVPTVEQPLHVIIIDELAAITAYETDSALRKRLASSLNLLLSQGRAPGLVVVGGVQDIRKETVPMRDLFPYRVAFRLADAQAVSMIMSKGARDRGAHADEISPSTPGVAYVEVDGEDEPVRVRFPHITDDRIAATVATYAPGHADGDADVTELRPTDDAEAPETTPEEGEAA